MDEELKKALLRCTEADFEATVGPDLAPYLPSRDAPRAAKVLALEQCIAAGQVRPADLRQRLRARAPQLLPDIDGWRWMMRNRVDAIPVIGFSQVQAIRIPHDTLFIELALYASRGRRDAEPAGASDSTAPIAETLARVQRWRAEDKELAGLAIIGQPGAGKTTLLRHIWREVTTKGSGALGLAPDLVPLLLSFGRLARLAVEGKGLDDVLEDDTAADKFPGVGRALLENRPPALFLIDGLDEVNTTAELDRVCGWLVRELDRWRGSFFVLGCRLAAWPAFREALGSRFARADVQWLQPPAVRRYIHGWFSAVYRQDPPPGLRDPEAEAAGAAAALLSLLLTPDDRWVPAWERLARTPLILAIMCLVHHRLGQLPEGREALYGACLEVLISAWARHRQREERAGGGGLEHDKVVRALAPAALQAQRQGDGQDVADLDERAFFDQLATGILDAQLQGQSAESLAHTLEADCGLLSRSRPEVWRFAHLNLQEYLAARHLAWLHAAGRPLDARPVVPWLVDRREEARWKEPTLLTLAHNNAAIFGPWLREMLWRPEPGRGEALLRAAVLERGLPDPGPLQELLEGAMRPTGWGRRLRLGLGAARRPEEDPATLRLALSLLGLRPLPPALLPSLEALRAHPDAGVRDAVLGLIGGRSAGGAPAGWGEIRLGARASVDLGGVRMSFVGVPPGEFWMGATRERWHRNYDPQACFNEAPVHTVQIAHAFWLAQHPVTNAQFRAYCDSTNAPLPPTFEHAELNDPDMPVVTTSLSDTMNYCHWLSGKLPKGYRADIPTEAEWEYAARGSTERPFQDAPRYPWGNSDPNEKRAVFDGQPLAKVGGRPGGAGPFGAEDQAGNVWEWCRSAYRSSSAETIADDRFVNGGENLVLCRETSYVIRGGAWNNSDSYMRCATRVGVGPFHRSRSVGFRVVVRSPPASAFDP